MPLIKGWSDPNTGASFGQACYVVAEVITDTTRRGTQIRMATYAGLAEYSNGKQPVDQTTVNVTGSVWTSTFETPARSQSQTYVAGLLQFSGAQVL